MSSNVKSLKHPHYKLLNQYLMDTSQHFQSEVPHYQIPDLMVWYPLSPAEVIADVGGILNLRLQPSISMNTQEEPEISDDEVLLALDYIRTADQITGSGMQRHMGIGFNRAMNIMDKLINDGLVRREPSGINLIPTDKFCVSSTL